MNSTTQEKIMYKDSVDFSIYGPTISGQGEAQSKVFRKVVGKRGTWYVAIQENSEDNIYVVTNNKDGMAGATLKFTLEDGSVEDVHAPWHSNGEDLFRDTGIDVRGQSYHTYVISLGKHRSEGTSWSRPDVHTEVLECASEPILIGHEEIKERAKKFAQQFKQKVWVSYKGLGGGCAGWEDYKEG